jgi:hypothetical protein
VAVSLRPWSNLLLGRSRPAAFAEGNASSHTRMYLAEVLVCPGLKRVRSGCRRVFQQPLVVFLWEVPCPC